MTMNRRTFVQGAAVSVLSPAVIKSAAAAAADPIVIASMYDLSGGLEGAGKPMYDVLVFAAEELNASGGLLGRPIKVVSFDTQTNMQLYAQYAQEAALKHKVAVVHGGITSASREVIRPVLNRYKTLYFYDMPYEGGVCDRNIFICGVTPGHDTELLVKHAMKNWGKKVYTLAADYNYGQITSDWVKKFVREGGGEVLGTEFFPLDATNFGSTISKIQAAKPDWIMTILVGGGPISFYRQFAAAGLAGKLPIASTTFAGANEQLVLTAEESNGIVLCKNYIEAIDSEVNKTFLTNVRKRYGADYQPISDLTMSSYQGVHLWAAGVKKAGTLDRMKVIEALESGISLELPSGTVSIDPITHHCIIDVHMAVMKDKQLVLLEKVKQRKPWDTANVCDLKKNPNEAKQYVIKVN
jgi:urea transport system substrate-binding protein